MYSDGFTGLIAIRFQPWGFSGFAGPSGMKMTELINTVLPAAAVMGESLILLEEQLAGKSKEGKLALIIDLFADGPKADGPKADGLKADGPKGPRNTPGIVQPIAEEMKRKNGVVKIAALAKTFHMDSRKLERCFTNKIGMTAKMFARILRFNYARQLIERNPAIPLASLTYEAGYADQAHFSKNFREMFNYSPAEYRQLIKESKGSAGGAGKDVVFLQDNA